MLAKAKGGGENITFAFGYSQQAAGSWARPSSQQLAAEGERNKSCKATLCFWLQPAGLYAQQQKAKGAKVVRLPFAFGYAPLLFLCFLLPFAFYFPLLLTSQPQRQKATAKEKGNATFAFLCF